jgi:TonB family protein
MRHLVLVAGLIFPGMALGETPVPEYQEYEPLEIIRTVPMTFPAELSQQNITEGEVVVMVWVDDTGRLMDWMLVAHTHALFAKEVLDELPKWRFKATRVRGQPINTRVELQIFFKKSEVLRVISADMGESAILKNVPVGRVMSRRIYTPEELDQPLDAVVEIAPRPPDRLGAVAREGSVVVEYLIDTDGKVRMPMIVSSDDEAFTDSVLLAITEWRYAVPKHTGKPVIACVRRKFTFSPPS